MPNRPLNKTVFLPLIALCFCGISSPAFAGFQWVAPPDAPLAGAPPADMQPVPAPSSQAVTQSPEVISPVIIGAQPAPAPAIQPSAAPMAAPAPAVDTASAMPMASGEAPVHGFANNVPLAVALRQILPAGYGFSVDPDVDMGVLVSFKGGKPWRDTLQDALAPAGLGMREHGQMVDIGYGTHTANAAPVPSSQPMPEPISVAQRAPMPPSTGTPPIMMGSPPHDLTPPPGSSLPDQSATVSSTASETWIAERGATLHKVLGEWCKRSNVEYEWLAEYDYPLEASVTFTGSFEDAVRNLLNGFEGAHPQPTAELHANANAGQMVLVVQTRGNNYTD